MEREYDLFEIFPNGDILWRGTVTGHDAAIHQLRQLSGQTKNELRVIHLPTKAVIAIMNEGGK